MGEGIGFKVGDTVLFTPAALRCTYKGVIVEVREELVKVDYNKNINGAPYFYTCFVDKSRVKLVEGEL